MKIITKISLILIISIFTTSFNAQTQSEFINHINTIQNINNEFMSNYLNFYSGSSSKLFWKFLMALDMSDTLDSFTATLLIM